MLDVHYLSFRIAEKDTRYLIEFDKETRDDGMQWSVTVTMWDMYTPEIKESKFWRTNTRQISQRVAKDFVGLFKTRQRED